MELKLLKLNLFNFCQFSSLSYTLEDGMTRLVAENGRGKTNACRGLIYAFTSWFDPSWGDQSDLQKDDESIPGYAEVEFSLEGQEYRLRRYTMSGTKTPDVLYNEDTELVVKRQRVNSWLEERLPVTLPVLAQLMWVRQDRLHWLLNSTASSVNLFLGLIFDTKKLEKMRDQLKRVIDTIADLRDDFKDRADSYRKTLEELPDITELEKQHSALEQEVLALTTRIEGLKNSISEKEYIRKKSLISCQLKEAEQNLAKIETELSQIPEVAVDEDEWKKVTDSINVVRDNLQKCQLKISKHVSNKSNLEQKLRDLTTGDISVCQYCGAALEDIEAYKNKKASVMFNKAISYTEALSYIEATIKSETEALEQAEKAYNDYASLHDKYDNRLTVIREQVSQSNRRKDLLREKTSIEGSLNSLKLMLDRLESTPRTDDDADDLKKKLKEATTELHNTQEQINKAKVSSKVCSEGLIQCEKDKVEYERNTNVKRLFTRLRDVYGQSRAQARYISSKIDKINDSIDHYLRLSEMPFSLELDIKTHTFRYHMMDSDITHPAGMLSGAQSAAAALAIQMALIDSAFPELPLLIVDEADAALSPANKFIAARLYRTLTDNLNGSVIVISQSDEVSDDCDNVWELT